MSAGAAYGNGIYFASNTTVSMGYCGDATQVLWPKSMFSSPGNQFRCLALCEIVDKKDDFTHYPGKMAGNKGFNRPLDNAVYVVPRSEYVTTRFFIVNPRCHHDGIGIEAEELVRESFGQGKLERCFSKKGVRAYVKEPGAK